MCIDRDDSSNEFPEYKIEKQSIAISGLSCPHLPESQSSMTDTLADKVRCTNNV